MIGLDPSIKTVVVVKTGYQMQIHGDNPMNVLCYSVREAGYRRAKRGRSVAARKQKEKKNVSHREPGSTRVHRPSARAGGFSSIPLNYTPISEDLEAPAVAAKPRWPFEQIRPKKFWLSSLFPLHNCDSLAADQHRLLEGLGFMPAVASNRKFLPQHLRADETPTAIARLVEFATNTGRTFLFPRGWL